MSGLMLAAPVAFGAATVQSGTGFGFALLLGPALLAVLPPDQAVGALLVLGIEINLLVLLGERRRRTVAWTQLRPLLLAALPGLLLGALIVTSLPKAPLQVLLGAVLLAAALSRLIGIGERAAAPAAGGRARAGVGLATGALTTATSVNGPLLVLWLHAEGIRGARLRDSLSAAFLVLNIAGAAALAIVGDPATTSSAWVLGLIPLVAAGHLAGRAVFERLSSHRHEAIVLSAVLLAAGASLVAGLASLP